MISDTFSGLQIFGVLLVSEVCRFLLLVLMVFGCFVGFLNYRFLKLLGLVVTRWNFVVFVVYVIVLLCLDFVRLGIDGVLNCLFWIDVGACLLGRLVRCLFVTG